MTSAIILYLPITLSSLLARALLSKAPDIAIRMGASEFEISSAFSQGSAAASSSGCLWHYSINGLARRSCLVRLSCRVVGYSHARMEGNRKASCTVRFHNSRHQLSTESIAPGTTFREPRNKDSHKEWSIAHWLDRGC